MRKNGVYTDMAVEFFKHKLSRDDGLIRYYEVDVDEAMSKKLGKPVGRYATLETDAVLAGRKEDYARVSSAISSCLRSLIGECDTVLAVGLGNPDLTADALGDRVFKRLDVTRRRTGKSGLCALTPNVFGMTGIESYDIIAAVTQRISPDAVIAVDALTAAAPGRIASAFQVTDSGITPGSGVDNHRTRLDRRSLGVRVVSVGVPLVVYSSTIAREFCPGAESGRGDMIVTPKDVDILVEDCAAVIAEAINGCFGSRAEKESARE